MGTRDLVQRARELARLRKKALPGPWKVVPDEKWYNDEDDVYWNLGYAIPKRNWYDLRLISYALEDPHVWCTVGFRDKASAKLAAAAPEMAELLEKMADALEKAYRPRPGTSREYTEWCMREYRKWCEEQDSGEDS